MIKKFQEKIEKWLYNIKSDQILKLYQTTLINKAIKMHGKNITPCIGQHLDFYKPGHYIIESLPSAVLLFFYYNKGKYTHAQSMTIKNKMHLGVIVKKLKKRN